MYRKIFLFLLSLINHAENKHWSGEGLCVRQVTQQNRFDYRDCIHTSGYVYNSWQPHWRVKFYEVDRVSVFCCQGYKNNNPLGQVMCSPECNPVCINSTCIKPNTCKCFDGHYHLNQHTCIPICNPGCINADCTGVNVCECHKGFRKVGGLSNVCKPVCNPQCVNGLCNERGICECYEGFILRPDSSNECEPVCSTGCINSTCVALETCRCIMGYEQISNYSCRPVCSKGCGPGVCIFPEHCQCPNGYNADIGYSCEPTCSSGCDNGYCVAPDICVCLTGYTLNNDSTCEPLCNNNCINAECISPDTCECLIGFTNVSDFECIPQCYPECINGYCNSPDVCICKEGFHAHPEDLSICLPELGHYSEFGPLSYMNIYNFQSILVFTDDNETVYLNSVPNITIHKPCSILLPNPTTTSNDTDPSWNSTILSCQPHFNTSQLDVKFYCNWPYDNETTPELYNNLNYSSTLNPTLKQNLHADLTLYLVFPESSFNKDVPGFCSFSTSLQSQQRFFSIYEELELVLKIRSNLTEIEEMKMPETKGESGRVQIITYGLLATVMISGLTLLAVIYKLKRRLDVTLRISQDDDEDNFL